MVRKNIVVSVGYFFAAVTVVAIIGVLICLLSGDTAGTSRYWVAVMLVGKMIMGGIALWLRSS